MNTIEKIIRRTALILLVLLYALLYYVNAQAQEVQTILPIKALSAADAAMICLRKHYPYFVRIGPKDALCLLGTAGVVNAIDAQHYLKMRIAAAMNGQLP